MSTVGKIAVLAACVAGMLGLVSRAEVPLPTEFHPAWMRDLVVYEIATKSFNSPNGPEQGTFRSVMEKLPYLQELGVNGIWKSVLVAGNPTSRDVDLFVRLPFEKMGRGNAKGAALRDVWNDGGAAVKPDAQGWYRIRIPHDRVARGGLAVYEF